jgi:5-methylcytosine-specific restriction endonuclease McrA
MRPELRAERRRQRLRGHGALTAIVLALAMTSAGAADRSRTLRAEFMREHPCPSTGKTRGPCPGWQVDHAVPLCLGGPAVDARANLRWIEIEPHKAKTRDDVRLCRRVKREVVAP